MTATEPEPARSPVRMCVGCRTRAGAAELLRVVAVADGPGHRLQIDHRHRAPGRGAWLHPELRCARIAEKRRVFARALRVPGPLDAAPVIAWVQQQYQHDEQHHRAVSSGVGEGSETAAMSPR